MLTSALSIGAMRFESTIKSTVSTARVHAQLPKLPQTLIVRGSLGAHKHALGPKVCYGARSHLVVVDPVRLLPLPSILQGQFGELLLPHFHQPRWGITRQVGLQSQEPCRLHALQT